MNSQTGDIKEFRTIAEAEFAGYDVEIPPAQVKDVTAMNRHERRAWAKLQKKKQKHQQEYQT